MPIQTTQIWSKSDLHIFIEEDVAELEIAVDDLVVVEVLDSQEDLVHEVASLRLRDGLAPLVQLHQRPAATELCKEVPKQ